MKNGFLFLLTFMCSFCVWGEDYYQEKRVRHDPFQKPNIPQKNSEAPALVKAPPLQPPSWTPHLKATLRAGRNSMANVNGKIIKLGDTINGYQLVAVDEQSAILVKNKQRLHLTIDYEPTK